MTANAPHTAKIQLPEKLQAALHILKENYSARSTQPPGQINDLYQFSAHDIYQDALESALCESLHRAHFGHATQVATAFKQAPKLTISAGAAIRYYNSHLPAGANRISESTHLPHSYGAALSPQDKKVYHAAQNLAHRDASRIVKSLAAYMDGDELDLETIQRRAGKIYKAALSAKASIAGED